MTTSRPRRTTISGARAQFAAVDAEVVNVSATGALVHAARPQAPGSQALLTLEINGVPLQLTARVIRCEPVAGPLSTSTGRYELALTFVTPPAEAVARLEAVSQTRRRPEADVRHLHVSLVRRCPKCHSRDVAKEGRRRYSCCQCGRVFTGFRVGFLRFSR
jgi:hypothetical protein